MADNFNEQQLCSEWARKFKEAMVHKAPYTSRWQTYLDAYYGDYFKNTNLPDFKSNMVSNYIYSVIETIRPLMLDNDPAFQAIPRQPQATEFSNDLQEAFSYEWEREGMKEKIARELVTTLVCGTSIFFIPWDSDGKNVRGIPVNIFNLFPDPLATCVKDAEYLIYAKYCNEVILRRKFPALKDKLIGGSIRYSELVQNKDKNSNLRNQILVLEIYTKDYEVEEVVNQNEKVIKSKYPNGRKIVLCPELGIVLDDGANIYNDDDEFPFELLKDVDVPDKFWGEGEVAQLLSPQIAMNDLNNAIIDTAKTTANAPWIIDKNSGIPYGKITSRPGLVIRKNPGTDVGREQPTQMPAYISNSIDAWKGDVQEISGMYNTLKGDGTTGVYTAQGILALQEAGQVRIRLKVKLMEGSMGRILRKWFSRMRQFWKEDRWIGVTNADGSYNIKLFVKQSLYYDYNVKITAGSTMPVNRSAMLDLMIRLAQTPMPDGENIVDREAVVQYLPEEIKSALMKRMNGNNQSLEELTQGLQQTQQAMQQFQQEFQSFAQEMQKKDEQIIGTVEQLMSSVEQLNKQILQLNDKHDKLEKDKIEKEKIEKLKEDSYNNGYNDAENILNEGMIESEETSEGDVTGGLPEEILAGLEGMNDEELQMLMSSNPEMIDLINQ